jgi:hypothetical protein
MRILAALALFLLLACSSKSNNPTGPTNKTPYAWSLNLKFETEFDSIAQNATLSASAQGSVSGTVNRFDNAILADTLYFALPDYPLVPPVQAVINSTGNFTFQAADLLGNLYSSIRMKIFLHARNTNDLPVPDTLRVTLNRFLAYPWTLDVTLPGGLSFQGLSQDTSATDTANGTISGTVNSFNAVALVDSIYFVNRTHGQFSAAVPLDTSGQFSLAMSSVVGNTRGIQSLMIRVKPAGVNFKPSPDSIGFRLNR